MPGNRKDHTIDTDYPLSLPGSQNNLGDTSEPLFALYSRIIEKEDNSEAERHQKNAEGIVIFTGLFSAALAALIAVTIQDLKPGPQDTLPFSPPTYAIWVNSLWISSLVISITSALLATLMQQWTRRTITITQPPGCAHKRARIREHIQNGNSNLHFLLATDGVPTLLHLSVFLFFAGLLILLRHINHTVFNAVVGWVVLCVVIYAHITILPIYQPANPRYGPFSSMVWHFYADMLYPVFKTLRGTRILDVPAPPDRLLKRVGEKADDIVFNMSPKFDAKILETLLETMGEDDSREKFFEAIPGFFDSELVHTPEVKEKLPPIFFTNFPRTVVQFLDQTLTSDSVSEIVRCRRLLTCLNATHRVLGERACRRIANKIISRKFWIEMPPSPEIGLILRRWSEPGDTSSITHIGSCIIARIIFSVENHDETWMALARSHLGVSDEDLKGYLKNRDSVLLANLIKTTRLFLNENIQFEGVLQSITGFKVQNTCSEQQQLFCKLWNETVSKSKDFEDLGHCIFVLKELCPVYEALHTSPATVPVTPASIAATNDSLLLGPSYSLCPDPQHNHHPPNASRQVTTVAASPSSSPPGVQPLSPPLQRDETNIISHLVLDTRSLHDPLSPLREFPAEFRTHVPPGLGHSYSTTTSHTLATPRDISVSDPDVIVVAGERDSQDLNAHSPHQPDPDPHAPVNSMGTSGRGKSSV